MYVRLNVYRLVGIEFSTANFAMQLRGHTNALVFGSADKFLRRCLSCVQKYVYSSVLPLLPIENGSYHLSEGENNCFLKIFFSSSKAFRSARWMFADSVPLVLRSKPAGNCARWWPNSFAESSEHREPMLLRQRLEATSPSLHL